MDDFEQGLRPDERLLQTKIAMQIELAAKYHQDFTEFANTHGKDFNDLVVEHPELYEKFKENPDATLDEIGEQIYH